MKLDVFLTPGELVNGGELAGRAAVAIDVLRATSTMVEALANGASWVIPTGEVEEARLLVQRLGPGDVLLCGERGSRRVDGFDLGNSPLEFVRDRVAGQGLVMTTTNGTTALLAAAGSRSKPPRRTVVGSLLNLEAVAQSLVEADDGISILCAGKERRFAVEDTVAAGLLVKRVEALSGGRPELNDAAAAAETLAERHADSLEEMLAGSAAGRQLIEVGHGDDLAFCGQLDRHPVVPELVDGRVKLS